jgi:hypothetical protein
MDFAEKLKTIKSKITEGIKSKSKLTTKMNATIVMNNADLVSHQILPFVLAPIPSCCDRCKMPTPNSLRLFKYSTAIHTFTHQSFPREYYSLQDIPKEFKDNEDLMATIEAVSVFNEFNRYYCEGCWCMTVANDTNILQDKVAKDIKKAYPNFDETQIKKELKLIKEGGLLFKTHRIKKTQEKAKLYAEFVYSALRSWFAILKEGQRDNAEYHKHSIAKYITKKQMRVCKENSNHWVKEIRQRKIAKWFAERKIPQKFYSIITSQMYNCSPFPTWERFAENYEGHSAHLNEWANSYERKGDLVKAKQTRCPPLPKWWNDL